MRVEPTCLLYDVRGLSNIPTWGVTQAALRWGGAVARGWEERLAYWPLHPLVKLLRDCAEPRAAKRSFRRIRFVGRMPFGVGMTLLLEGWAPDYECNKCPLRRISGPRVAPETVIASKFGMRVIGYKVPNTGGCSAANLSVK